MEVDEPQESSAAPQEASLQGLSRDDLLRLVAQIQQTPQGAAQVASALQVVQQPPAHEESGTGPSSSSAKKDKKDKKKKKEGKAEREFDFSRHPTRHIALLIAYEGDNYAGFASQGSVVADTVEAHLLAALEKVKLIKDRRWACYSRCGRTDKGVSALRQVVGVRVRSSRRGAQGAGGGEEQEERAAAEAAEAGRQGEEEEGGAEEVGGGEDGIWSEEYDKGTEGEMDYCGILNRVLPRDIRALGWSPVPRAFNARFCASQRTYRYFFVGQGLDLAAMEQAAAKLVGDHDFRNLCKMDVTKTTNFRRVVYSARIHTVLPHLAWTPPAGQQQAEEEEEEEEDGGGGGGVGGAVCCLEIRGQAFLWHMVRCIMAVLMLVGKRLEGPEVVDFLLDVDGQCPRKPHYAMASEMPLVLHDCTFPRLSFHFQASNLSRLWSELQAQWAAAAVRLSRLTNTLDLLSSEARVTRKDLAALLAASRPKDHNQTQGGGRGKKRKAPSSSGREEEEAAADQQQQQAVEEEEGLVTWGEALQVLRREGAVLPGEEDRGRHVALRDRQVNRGLEEVVEELQGRKRQVYEDSLRKRTEGQARDQAFFVRLQGGAAPPNGQEGAGEGAAAVSKEATSSS